MSQASEQTDGGSVSKQSNASLPKPPRYPSFSFRKAVSKTPGGIKDDPPSSFTGERTQPTMSESVDDCPRDGKLVHVRVTLGYLKSIQIVEKGKPRNRLRRSDSTSSLVTAFASLDPQISSDHNFAPSMPLSLTSDVTHVVWPKQKHSNEESVDKSNRRLYFSTTLQKDSDHDAELSQVLSHEDDLSTVTGTCVWNHEEKISYAPQVIKIQLGVARGKDLLHLGIVTLVVDGRNVTGMQMDLPVRTLLPGEDDSSSAKNSPKIRGLKRLFGKKSKSAQNAFAADDYEYMFTPNALLRIRIDVTSDETPFVRTSLHGPAVWGDGIEDDNDSFVSIVVMDIASEKPPAQEEATTKEGSQLGGSLVQINKDTSESIEVVDNPTGPSIISTRRLKYAEPDVLDLDSRPSHPSIAPVTSVMVSPQGTFSPTIQDTFNPMSQCTDLNSPLILATTGMMCGFTDVFRQPAIEADTSQPFNYEDSSTIATSHYKGTREEAWKRAAREKKSTHSIAASSGTLHDKSFETFDETEDYTSGRSQSRDSYSRASQSRASYSRASQSRASASPASAVWSTVSGNNISIGEDTLKSLDEAKKALKLYAQRTGENYRDMLEHLETVSTSDILSFDASIGEDTIDSVFEAKEILQSYAERVGVDVEDLLHIDLNQWDSSKFLSPSSTLGTSADETEGTNNASNASSKSQFSSLFVDDDE